MKIAFHLNCLEQGGAERVVSNLANQFAEDGDEVYILTEWKAENEFRISDKVKRVHVGLKPEDDKKGRITKFLLRIRYLHRFMKQEKPDVVAAFAHRAIYRALTASIGTGVPVITAVRTDPARHYDHWDDKIQIPLLFPRAAGCVFQTEGQRDFFPAYVRKKSTIILNPIHDKYLNVPGPSIRQKEVVQSGRLVDFKNQPMLIEAFLEVHKKHPDYVLKIYGPDSKDGTKEILEHLIEQNKAQEYVMLMGGSDELEKQLPNASVYAFSSDWEGLPNALLEALSLGLPVVATDCPCGGPRTVIRSGENGILVPIKNREAMTEAINLLIENRKLAERLGEKARELGPSITASSIAEQWRQYMKKIVADKRNR